jgi:hypothetical protein
MDEDDDAGTIKGFTIARCLLTTSRSGFLGLQIDGMGDGATMPVVELHHPYGFLARPKAPTAEGDGCDVLYAWEGTKGHALLALADGRHTPLLPPVKEGGSIQYGINDALKPTFALIDGETGTYQVYVPTKGGSACTLSFDVSEEDKEAIRLLHAMGMGISLDGETKTLTLNNRTGSASIILDDDGITLSGNVKVPGGVTMGGAGAQPLTLDPLLQAELANIATSIGGCVTLLNAPGPVTGAPSSVTPYVPGATGTSLVTGK